MHSKLKKVAFLREGEIFSRKSLNWYKSQEFYAYFKVQTRFSDKILPKIVKAKIWQLQKSGFFGSFFNRANLHLSNLHEILNFCILSMGYLKTDKYFPHRRAIFKIFGKENFFLEKRLM
jgi:hypothetical protein